jgi:hypothetical protein
MRYGILALAALGSVVLVALGRAREAPVRSDAEWNDLCVVRQTEAYHVGFQQGALRGELQGQENAFAAVAAQVKSRDEVFGEITAEDVERARKGMLH